MFPPSVDLSLGLGATRRSIPFSKKVQKNEKYFSCVGAKKPETLAVTRFSPASNKKNSFQGPSISVVFDRIAAKNTPRKVKHSKVLVR